MCNEHKIDICAFPDLSDGLTIGDEQMGLDFSYTPGQDYVHICVGVTYSEEAVKLTDL